MLESVFNQQAAAAVTTADWVLCTLASLALGLGLSAVHRYRNQSSPNFLMTLAILPAIVQAVIMLVNGNLGTGIAVMGAFSLVRFRSVPGDSREIGSVFLAMAMGLAAGMGYLGMAFLLLAIVGAATVLLVRFPWKRQGILDRDLKVTIPEDLDYYGIFDDIFSGYTLSHELMRVKTVSMGSLYELNYRIRLKTAETEKEFIDQLRCRNGNLPIVCGRQAAGREEL